MPQQRHKGPRSHHHQLPTSNHKHTRHIPTTLYHNSLVPAHQKPQTDPTSEVRGCRGCAGHDIRQRAPPSATLERPTPHDLQAGSHRQLANGLESGLPTPTSVPRAPQPTRQEVTSLHTWPSCPLQTHLLDRYSSADYPRVHRRIYGTFPPDLAGPITLQVRGSPPNSSPHHHHVPATQGGKRRAHTFSIKYNIPLTHLRHEERGHGTGCVHHSLPGMHKTLTEGTQAGAGGLRIAGTRTKGERLEGERTLRHISSKNTTHTRSHHDVTTHNLHIFQPTREYPLLACVFVRTYMQRVTNADLKKK